MDNYYTSPGLFCELESQNIYACGTLRVNRKGVSDAMKIKRKLRPTECIFRRSENLLVVKYHDKRNVCMLSTIHEATVSVLDKVDRTTNNTVSKPTCIVDYIRLMGVLIRQIKLIHTILVYRKLQNGTVNYFFTCSTCV